MTPAQRKMLKRIKTAPVGVYGPSDDRRITKGLETRGWIERWTAPLSRSVCWKITPAGVEALGGAR